MNLGRYPDDVVNEAVERLNEGVDPKDVTDELRLEHGYERLHPKTVARWYREFPMGKQPKSLPPELKGELQELVLEYPSKERLRDPGLKEVLDRVRDKLGLSGPYPVQYARWLGNFFTGDFGTSWSNRRPVLDRMLPRILVSLELGVLAVGIAITLGILLGVPAAVRRDTWVDYVFRSVSMSLQAMPGFWLALMTIVMLVAVFQWIPPI